MPCESTPGRADEQVLESNGKPELDLHLIEGSQCCQAAAYKDRVLLWCSLHFTNFIDPAVLVARLRDTMCNNLCASEPVHATTGLSDRLAA